MLAIVTPATAAVLIPMIPSVALRDELLFALRGELLFAWVQKLLHNVHRNIQELLLTFSDQYRLLSTGTKLQPKHRWTSWICGQWCHYLQLISLMQQTMLNMT
jgi:hypothetical protein